MSDSCRRPCCTTLPLRLETKANKSGFTGVQPRKKGFQVHVTPHGKRQKSLVHTPTAEEGAKWYARWKLNAASVDPLSLPDFQQHHRLPVATRKANGVVEVVAESDDETALVAVGHVRDLKPPAKRVRRASTVDESSVECPSCGQPKRVSAVCGMCSQGASRRFGAYGEASRPADVLQAEVDKQMGAGAYAEGWRIKLTPHSRFCSPEGPAYTTLKDAKAHRKEMLEAYEASAQDAQEGPEEGTMVVFEAGAEGEEAANLEEAGDTEAEEEEEEEVAAEAAPLIHAKPRGRPRKGMVWNYATGEWERAVPPAMPPPPEGDAHEAEGASQGALALVPEEGAPQAAEGGAAAADVPVPAWATRALQLLPKGKVTAFVLKRQVEREAQDHHETITREAFDDFILTAIGESGIDVDRVEELQRALGC